MIHFTTFFALVIGSMEVIQPAAAGVLLAGLSPRIDLVLMKTFQRRQGSAPPTPPQCVTICNPVNSVINSPQQCSPSECCTSTFEKSYYNCFVCAEAAANDTDYTEAQMVLNDLYDTCASAGIMIPVLTFPGQDANQTLSSVVLPMSTVSNTASLSSQSITQSTLSNSTSSGPSSTLSQSTVNTPSQSTVAGVNTPSPTSSSASGIRLVETSCFNLITVAMMLGTWLYFAA